MRAVASTAKHTTQRVLPDDVINDDHDWDNDLKYDFGAQGDEDILIDTDIGELRSLFSDMARLDMATQNSLMLDMLRENRA